MTPTASLQLDTPLMLTGTSPLAALSNGSPASTTDPFAQLLKNSSEAGPLVQSNEPDPLAAESAIYDEVSPQLALAAGASTALVAVSSGTSLPCSASPELQQQFGTKPASATLLVEHQSQAVQPILPDARQLETNGAVLGPGQVQEPPLARMVGSRSDSSEKYQPAQQPFNSGAAASGSTAPEHLACDADDLGGGKQAPSPESSRTPGTEIIGALSIRALIPGGTNMAEMPGAQLHFPAPATQAANAPATPMPAATAPHDLGHTIDRLVEARMAGRAGEVRLAVPHDDFGPVAIRLDSTAAGLAANLSSADPDFVPAVNTALAERMQAERVAADRGLPTVEPVRVDTAGTRGHDFAQNGRNSTDAGGSGTQHRSPPDNGSETRKWMRSDNQPAQNELGSGSQRNSPPSGLYA